MFKSYGIRRIVGDRYGGEFCREPFRAQGIDYQVSEKPKSDIYRDVLPVLNSKRCELLDLPRLTAQLCGLERRTSRVRGALARVRRPRAARYPQGCARAGRAADAVFSRMARGPVVSPD